MDAFLDPFWNLDQVVAWAWTRDPAAVWFAATARGVTRRRNGLDIAVNSFNVHERKLAMGRNIESELWSASGWNPEHFKVAVDRLPCGPAMNALADAREAISEEQRKLINTAFVVNRLQKREAINLNQIQSPELQKLVAAAIAEEEPHGPPERVFVASFPIKDYLLFLLRSGRLKATGNLPGEILSREISPSDWGGLEIRCGELSGMLCVWRADNISRWENADFEEPSPEGDLANVRVARAAVLAEFPSEGLDAVLVRAANQGDGALTQATAEKAAKDAGVYQNRESVRNALERLGIAGKQGRRKKRGATA
jgi:hypothetical protein